MPDLILEKVFKRFETKKKTFKISLTDELKQYKPKPDKKKINHNKAMENFENYTYLLKHFLEVLEKEVGQCELFPDDEVKADELYEKIKNALKNNIWAYSKNDLKFVIETSWIISMYFHTGERKIPSLKFDYYYDN